MTVRILVCIIINISFCHCHAPHLHVHAHLIPLKLWRLMWSYFHSSFCLDFNTSVRLFHLDSCLDSHAVDFLIPRLGSDTYSGIFLCADALLILKPGHHHMQTPYSLHWGADSPHRASLLPGYTTHPIWVLISPLALKGSSPLLHEFLPPSVPPNDFRTRLFGKNREGEGKRREKEGKG